MAQVCGLLLVYRRCVACADVSCLVRFGHVIRCGPMWYDVD